MNSKMARVASPLYLDEAVSDREQFARIQYGLLAYRLNAELVFELLLVRSKTEQGWFIPTGWPIKGLGSARSAAREGYEQAGISGTVGSKSVGAFSYSVAIDGGRGSVPCEVSVFPMLVTRQLEVGPESHDRISRWFSLGRAISVLEPEELRKLISVFAEKSKLIEENKRAQLESRNVPDLIRFEEAAKKLGVTIRTMRRWVAAGKMPPRIKDGREKKFCIKDIEMKAAEVTIEESAELLGVTVRTLRRWVAAGKMPTRTATGRKLKFRRADIETLMRQGQYLSAD